MLVGYIYINLSTAVVQVALKRQQAAEDAIALNMRSVATGEAMHALPEGPIIGLPGLGPGPRHPETNAERRIKGEHTSHVAVVSEDFTITEKAPTRAFYWLNVLTMYYQFHI